MEKIVKAGFDKILKEFENRDEQAKAASKRNKVERDNFEDAAKNKIEAVVAPALEEIEKLLTAKGWQCNVVREADAMAVHIGIYRGALRGTRGGRPHIKFETDKSSPKIVVTSSSPTRSGKEIEWDLNQVTEWDLNQVTADNVQGMVLQVFERIVAEAGK